MNTNTSTVVTSTGGLATAAKNNFKSDPVANSVLCRARDSTNSRYRSNNGSPKRTPCSARGEREFRVATRSSFSVLQSVPVTNYERPKGWAAYLHFQCGQSTSYAVTAPDAVDDRLVPLAFVAVTVHV